MLLPLLFATLAGASAPVPSVTTDSLRPDQEIRQVALRHAMQIQRCYETHGLKVNPSMSGTIEVELVVLPTGRVDTATVSRSQLAGPGKREVEACVVTAVRNWRFERGPFVKEAIVYPFQLVRDRAARSASYSPRTGGRVVSAG
jgi:TonB family protein